MRFFLSIFILILVCINSKAQNAYYDAKKLAKWEGFTDTKKQANAAEYYAILLRYGKDINTINRSYPQINNLKRLIKEAYAIKKIKEASKIEIINKILIVKKDKLAAHQDIIIYIENLKRNNFKRSILKNKSKEFFIWLLEGSKKENLDIARKLESLNTSLIETKIITTPFYVEELKDSILKTVDSIVSEFNNDIPKMGIFLSSKINELEKDLYQKIVNDSVNIYTSFFNLTELQQIYLIGHEEFLLIAEAKRQLIEIESKLQKSETILLLDKADEIDPIIKSSISDQNFPSQSEIIDALAIYMARRFKQEVALTFVENFTRYIKDNVFAKEIFPSTYNMLNNQDPYTVTKAGSEWRNAVSEDLIKLPQHLVNSTVVQKWVNNKGAIAYLHDATLIGRYIAKKYSYVDMIRSLYEGNGLEDENNDTLKGSYMKKAILTSYIINQEFYDSSRAKYWITPEELYKMNHTEIQCLGELLSIKYDSSFTATFSKNPLANNAIYKKLQKQYTDLLSLFKQFENGQVAAFIAREKGSNAKDAFWDFQRIFVDFLLKQIPDEKTKTMVRNVQKIFFVYDYVSNKNYGAAINSSLEILDTLMQQKSPTNYLRAFVNSNALAKVENIALTNLALKIPDQNILIALEQMEDYAKLALLISHQKSDYKITDISSLKKIFKEFFNIDHINISDDILQKFVMDNLDKSIKQIWIEIESFKAVLEKKYDKIVDVKKLLENLQFYTPKSYDELSQYFPLAEKFLLTKSPILLTNFRKISGFLTDASTVKDSRELSKVLEAYAQPPLSYKLTRKSIFSIDVNSYLGFWGGKEFKISKIEDKTNNNFKKFTTSSGLTVPLGLSFSWGTKRSDLKKINGKIRDKKTDKRIFYVDVNGKPKFLTSVSHSIFISIIDIAGPVSFRLGDDAAKGLPQNTRWSQVLAPGIHYILGLRNSPICVTAGFQITPQLRTYNDISSTPFSTGRFQVGLTYDMPLLNLLRKKPF